MKLNWHLRDRVERMILFNGAAFVVLWTATALGFPLWKEVTWPYGMQNALYKPWTLLTYMFSHRDFWHLLWNMILLYGIGKMLVDFLGDKVIPAFYLGGGVAGALMYTVGLGLQDLTTAALPSGGLSLPSLIGASASVMAVFWATVFLIPDFEIRLFGVLPLKLKWLGLGFLLYDLLGLMGSNAGGHWAHLGGALWGWGRLRYLQGRLWPVGTAGLFGPKRSSSPTGRGRALDTKTQVQAETDRLLDKISKGGYQSLKSSEKKWLQENHQG